MSILINIDTKLGNNTISVTSIQITNNKDEITKMTICVKITEIKMQ